MEGMDRRTAISQLLNPQSQPPTGSGPHLVQHDHHHPRHYSLHYQQQPDAVWNHQPQYQPYGQEPHYYHQQSSSTIPRPETTTMSETYQASDRASLRLIAKSTAGPSSLAQNHSSTPSSSSGGYDPYPAEHHRLPSPPVNRPSQPKRKRTTPQDNNSDASSVTDEGNPPKRARKNVGSPSNSSSVAARPPNSASSSISKRGYNAKKRSEAAQMKASASVSSPPAVAYTADSKGKAPMVASPGTQLASLTHEVQSARCMSNKYRKDGFPRCISCVRRWAGDTCRFHGLRLFMKDSNGQFVGVAFANNQRQEIQAMKFPTEWNQDLDLEAIQRTKLVAAKTLLPVLRQEREHVSVAEIIYRPRESDVRATCDTCMTSLFCSTWMCRLCGREACNDCFTQIKRLTRQDESMTEQERADQKREKERQLHRSPFFLACTKRNEHVHTEFTPVSRFCKKELEEAIQRMEAIDKSRKVPAVQYPLSPPRPSPPPPPPLYYPQNPMTSTPDQLPSHELPIHTKESLTSSIFQNYWQQGTPILIRNLLPDLSINWTPEYFIERYGSQRCIVVECQEESNKGVTVKEFFETFRPDGSHSLGPGVWKLKDWPPSNDFKTAFPELYEDFSQAVPIPDYVRRDGVMNIASHFPENAIAPDLGPKMYNAMATTEEPGSKGSTRLHMDMADALNIMTYASPFTPPSTEGEAGSSTAQPGCAAWDLFRVEDANKLRNFLQRKFQGKLSLDPIHSQQVYLDRELRKQLYDEEGVMSYRVYQRPGEAVFIPAGVAHQVCNLSGCIKVAIDFVSPENVERCEQLTREFREQNYAKMWKEDVLQLRNMLWFAWMSCCKQEAQLAANQEASEPDESPLPAAWDG